MSRDALGEKIGLSLQEIEKQECGASRISASMLFKILCALEISAKDFFGGFEFE